MKHPTKLELGKTYVCRDGSEVILDSEGEHGFYDSMEPDGFYYGSEEENGFTPWKIYPQTETKHPKDIMYEQTVT